MRRSAQINSFSRLCLTKLDVLDAFETVRICTAYRCEGKVLSVPPLELEKFSVCEPIYEDFEGWQQNTQGVQHWEDLPEKARDYLKRIESLLEVPIAIISTGPGREETIIMKALF